MNEAIIAVCIASGVTGLALAAYINLTEKKAKPQN